jgi:hypothetical protein
MTWSCAQNDETEKKFDKGSTQLRNAKHIELMAEGLNQPMSEEFRWSDWANFTKSYSAREVTFEADTFPAISGVVHKIQQLAGGIYYAGLWKQHFLEGLLWRLTIGANTRAPKRRQNWIAPSWSWASVKGEIRYSYNRSKAEYCARLEECRVICSGLDPFGALTAGFARITGPVTLITDVEAEDRYLRFKPPNCKVQLVQGRLTGATVEFDFVHHMSCDALMITPHLGVCIEKVEGTTNTYVRIGIVQTWEPASLAISDHVSPRSIILG